MLPDIEANVSVIPIPGKQEPCLILTSTTTCLELSSEISGYSYPVEADY